MRGPAAAASASVIDTAATAPETDRQRGEGTQHEIRRTPSRRARGETPEESPARRADRHFRALIASATHGVSPISLFEAWHDWALHLSIAPGRQSELVLDAARLCADFSRYSLRCALGHPGAGEGAEGCVGLLPQDRRFDSPSWKSYPFNVEMQGFLAVQRFWQEATTGIDGMTPAHERVLAFYGRQFLDLWSPTNFPLTHPDVLQRTLQENGRNFLRGLAYLAEDLDRLFNDRPPRGAESFKPGTAVAVTPGRVVFRNHLIELIQYAPTTPSVRPEPVLIVPAWIMKYYILDLSPENSLIRYLVGRGFTVFCISWKNPGKADRDLSFDDYRKNGLMAGLDAVCAITGAAKVHAVGYCLGGTLLSIGAAAMARDEDERLASLSLFAAQVDFTEAGELTLFIDESQVSLIEDLMARDGFLDQRRMAGAFQLLRSQDLIWSRLVHEYLMGERRPLNDLAAWNADATRMPCRMHSEYLRSLFLRNDLAAGRFEVGGRPVYLEDISVPVFAVATVTDHVAPWRSVFKIVHMLDTDIRFILTSGGHNAGIVSEPGHPRRSFRVLDHARGEHHPDPDTWLGCEDPTEGSWWVPWTEWLQARSGDPVVPPPLGGPIGSDYAAREPAPGTYVHIT